MPSNDLYEHPYPSPELAAAHPFRDLGFVRRPETEMRRRAVEFHQLMVERRSPRLFAPDPVPRDLIETAIATAGTAPSGAHKQPWRFVMTQDPEVKRVIREAAEDLDLLPTPELARVRESMSSERGQRRGWLGRLRG